MLPLIAVGQPEQQQIAALTAKVEQQNRQIDELTRKLVLAVDVLQSAWKFQDCYRRLSERRGRGLVKATRRIQRKNRIIDKLK